MTLLHSHAGPEIHPEVTGTSGEIFYLMTVEHSKQWVP